MAKSTQHQHVVPRAYLRGFADATKHVVVWRRGQHPEHRLHISNVAVRKGFYSFSMPGGAKSDGIEAWLDRSIESPAAPVLKALCATTGPLQGSGEAGVLARFVAAQLLRTPTVAGHMRDIDEHLRPFLFTLELLKAEGLNAADLSAAEMYQWQMAGRQMAETHGTLGDENSRLRTIMRTFDGFAAALSCRSWTVLAATDDLLITGDAPVATLNPLQSGWKGLLPAGAPVLMPITPTRLLVGEEHPLGQDHILRPELARAVNEEVAANADDAIIKAPSSSWPTYLDLASAPPKLPPPNITMEPSQAPPTQLTYPAISDPTVKDLLKQLGA
ncbi:uncharacterized protein DUF4238 [Kribbella steppae]|uniref:Uncharacterized protein DUF4238 n=1 Tax=Kribbella steppae TaxID=2512223 RepID=A0A4R2HPD1_9ACTN|nr:DUF4238 domain-containing protein [Kribbella steppae]TCO33053.1 uncharacterized protein DUF4238 [Kribbella steppae]